MNSGSNKNTNKGESSLELSPLFYFLSFYCAIFLTRRS